MRRLALALAVALLAAPAARADFVAAPFDYATRTTLANGSVVLTDRPPAGAFGAGLGSTAAFKFDLNPYRPQLGAIFNAFVQFAFDGPRIAAPAGVATFQFVVTARGANPGDLALGDFGPAAGNVGTFALPTSYAATIEGPSVAFEIGDLFRRIVATGAAAFVLQVDVTTPGVFAPLGTPGNASAALRPALSAAAATPEPGSAVLLGLAIGVGALVGRHRITPSRSSSSRIPAGA